VLEEWQQFEVFSDHASAAALAGALRTGGVVADVQGRAERLHVECHRRKTELPFRPNVQMTIPSSWGRCVLTIRGQLETTFTLYEFLEPTVRSEIG
jgi:hypothetical protein